MTIFSLDERIVVDAVSSVTPGWFGNAADPFDPPPPTSPGRAQPVGDVGSSGGSPSVAEPPIALVAERFARASWSGIAEPGDSVAGQLVRGLGASVALTALVAHRTAAQVRGALLDAGLDAIALEDVEAGLDRWHPRLIAMSALTSLRQAARCGARLLVPGDAEWPEGLGDLGLHEPLALWVRGKPAALRGVDSGIAIVGARAATGYGDFMAMELAAGLVDRGYGVVSGAAYGVDGMAHRSALASSGRTFAFLAGGVDRFYPNGHHALLTRIADVGVVLSELPCGSAPTKWRFLQRNRLIAAASLATVVVEAGVRSGSLNTAAHAASLGRPIGAVPGPVTSVSSAGCHRLLREFDAVCVTSADDVVELVAHLRAPAQVLEFTAIPPAPTLMPSAPATVRVSPAPVTVRVSPAATPGSPVLAPPLCSAATTVDDSSVETPTHPGSATAEPLAGATRETRAILPSVAGTLKGRAAPRAPRATGRPNRPAEHVRVLDAVSRRSGRSTEDIARRSGLSVAGAQAALGALGLEGVVEEESGGWRAASER